MPSAVFSCRTNRSGRTPLSCRIHPLLFFSFQISLKILFKIFFLRNFCTIRAKFFPVYFELQDKKKKLNDESWDLMRKGKDDKTTEAQYAEINEKVANNRIAADQLDKTYLGKFKKILSSKKIFLVQRAEMRFHREMIKGMNRSKDKGDDSKKK